MGNLVPLALAAAFYPTTLAVVVIIFTRPNPARLLGAFLIGGLTTSVLVGLGVLALIKGSGVVGGSSSHSISPTIDVIAGLLSLSLAFLVATGRPLPFAGRRAERKSAKANATAEPKDPWSKRMLERDSLAVAFGLGILIDLPSVWYLAALKDIAEAWSLDGRRRRSGAALQRDHVRPGRGPTRLLSAGARAGRGSGGALRQWSRSHLRQIGAVVATVIGAYLLINGIVGLA